MKRIDEPTRQSWMSRPQSRPAPPRSSRPRRPSGRLLRATADTSSIVSRSASAIGFVERGSPRGRALYAALKRSPLWTRGGVPGSATVGDYPRAWTHTVSRVVGLTHYHDRLHWSWLTALAAKVAHRMGDVAEAERIFDRLADMVEEDGTVGEIYRERGGRLRPFRSFGYQSADDFTWGAGMIRHALDATRAPAGR